MKNILIIGATSTIAAACARLWVSKKTDIEKVNFFLVARNADKLQQTAADLTARGADAVSTYITDLNQIADHNNLLTQSYTKLGKIDLVLIAHGSLPNQKTCEQDVQVAWHELSTNALSIISLLTLLANHMEQQKSGTIAVISSVAGDRGRPSNYLYGSAKAAVTTFCEGLRARLYQSGLHLLTIKPGLVDTPMTQGLPLPKLLVAKPEQVAKDIHKAIERKANTLYTPWFWQIIMTIIRIIPTSIFKKMRL